MSDPSGSSSTPKAIGSLAKRQSDVTRQGTQKLKFVPTLPQRRKKEDVKQEPTTSTPPSPPKPARGRGSGRGETRGAPRGRGRGIPPAVEMTASGPFALGPSQTGRATDRSIPPSTFATVGPSLPNIGISQTGPPLLGKDGKRGKEKDVKVEDDVYSDPDDGVEIVDMDQVQKIDWMAPDILRKERRPKDAKIKQEKLDDVDVDPGQELNLSESEEELEDLVESFTAGVNADAEFSPENQLYLFQFPSPFPTFIKNNVMDVDQPPPPATEKKVTFAADVKPEASTSQADSVVPEVTEPKVSEPVSGAIGRLEVYRSGAVKMRLTNDILLDVSASTQPSFLQHAVHLNKAEKRLVVLGEANKQFVVSPNVEALLSALDKITAQGSVLQDENLIKLE